MSLFNKIKLAWKHLLILLGLSSIITTPFLLKSTQGEIADSERLCFIGDVGMNNEGQEKIAKMLPDYCDRVIVLGDLVYPIGVKDENDPRAETHFLQHYRNLNLPFNLVMGNHDYYGNPDAWLKIAEKEKKWIDYKNNYWFTENNGLCLVALDTMPLTSLKKGPRYYAQAKWIKNVLFQKCDFRIVIGHHPYKSCGKHGHAKGRMKEFYEEFVIGRVDGIIAGHDHLLCYFNEKPFSITSGSGSKLRNKIKNNPTFSAVELGFVQMRYHGEKKATFKFITEKQIKVIEVGP